MRVLVVDDDADVRSGAVELLRENGHEVVAARDGREAIAALSGALPDVILLDLALPELGGDEFLERIRRRPALERIPVVVTSAWARNISPPVPIAGWLPKPIDPGELLALLQRIASAGAGVAARPSPA